MASSNATKNTIAGGNNSKSPSGGSKINLKTIIAGLLAILAAFGYNLVGSPDSEGSPAAIDPAEQGEMDSYTEPASQVETTMTNESEKQSEQLYTENKKQSPVKVDIKTINYEHDALPKTPASITSQVIRHKAYSSSYNADYKIPNWSFYELLATETEGRLPRSDEFQPDPNIPSRESSQLTDYRGSGLDRGHMAPSMDFNWDEAIENESYYLSNMCPQNHEFNSGIWLDLEHQVRRWARRDSAICVACGPILPRKDKNGRNINPVTGEEYKITTIGRSKVLVPEHFFKVILSPFGDHPKAIGFIMPNENILRRDGNGNAPIKDFAVNIDRVEEVTGIDFFAILPDDVENKIEKWYEKDDWFSSKRY